MCSLHYVCALSGPRQGGGRLLNVGRFDDGHARRCSGGSPRCCRRRPCGAAHKVVPRAMEVNG
ncbi:hypothetical protein PCLA_15r0071 [Pseudomonas citronellolis]|nr:hypothetical protein PCLA_15r0071 [Pseudomonas citronellolis]